MKKGHIRFFWFNYAIVVCLCFQGELLGFDEKDSFKEELKEEYGPNDALGEQTEADASTHDCA